MDLYLIRHGETNWNKEKRLQGREDIELNETGLRQAHECAAAFERIPVDCIVSSPLQRAKRMAEIIAASVKIQEVIVDPNLIERDFGALSGQQFMDTKIFFAYNEGEDIETLEAVIRRFMSSVERYRVRDDIGSMIMVSHGAAINAVLKEISGGAIGTGKTVLQNACISKIQLDVDKTEIVFFNKTAAEFEAQD